jgi:hypothetical protein
MKELTNEFLTFLSEEYDYLENVKSFLVEIPALIANGSISQMEFQMFLEKYEVQTSRYIFERNKYREGIAAKLHVKKDQVTFQLLVHVGYPEFEEKGLKLLKITNEIKMHLLKITIYLRNFAKMQLEFKRLNNFLYQKDYSPRSVETDGPYNFNRGRNFHGEA